MNLTGKTVLVFLEEDNTQRAYFRIRPLLSEEGPLDKLSMEQFPDEGFLRIVPDKNEQHTFKERMRTLAPICVLNLAGLNPDVQKIRSNKNYAPAKGEKNQFIVYSDAVKALDSQYYQVVSEAQLSTALTPLAYTRSGANIQGPFVRETGALSGDMIKLPPDTPNIFNVTLPDGRELLFYCPLPKAAPQEAPAQAPLAAPQPDEPSAAAQPPKAAKAQTGTGGTPSSSAAAPQAPAAVSPWKQQVDAMISGKPFNAPSAAAPEPAAIPPAPVSAPAAPEPQKQGSDRLAAQIGPAPAKNPKPDPASATAIDRIQALNGTLRIRSSSLRDGRSSLPMQPEADSRPVGGTKLYKPSIERKNTPRTRNDLTEAVDQIRNVSKYESRAEAPGAIISDTAQMGSIPNPVEQFRYILKRVWSLPDTHRQVADTILATSGMRQSLSRILTEGKSNLTIRAMQSQLQELEAERLMTLMQLDDAKKSKQQLKNEIAAELAKDKSSQLCVLETELDAKAQAFSRLEQRQEALAAERDEALKALRSFPWQHTLAAPAASDAEGDPKALAGRLSRALSAAGFVSDEDTALIFLALLVLCPGTMGICSATVSDARHAFRTAANALGANAARVHAALEFDHPIRIEEGGDGYAFTFDTAPLQMEYPGLIHMVGGEADDVYLNRITDTIQDRYTEDPWPVFWIEPDPKACAEDTAPQPPVSAALVRQLLTPEGAELDSVTAQLLLQLRMTMTSAGAPLPIATVTRMKGFILALKDLLSGGIAAAIDWAFMCFIVPHIRYNGLDPQILLPYVGAMPHTFRELGK